jgi:adenylate cyclase
VRILEGVEFCSPMREAERGRLTRADGTLPAGVRLACQTYVRGRVRITILAPGAGKKN